MVARFLVLIVSLGLMVGCAPTYADRGVGQDLYVRGTPAATNNLVSYFRELCAQLNLLQSGSSVTCSDYPALVQAGFNDIDQRCDSYLAWIDNKRTEAVRVKASLLAIGTQATTVLTLAEAGSKTIAYVAAALGLAGSLYDANSNSMLLGLESSTIKTIVYQRRLEFRRQFSQVPFSTTPAMVFALRSYLRICTPQTIVLDANTYALSVASGITPQSLEASVLQEAEAIGAGLAPVTPLTLADTRITRGEIPRCAECEKLFADPGFTPERIKAAQTALCVEADGKVGQGTLQAVQNYRDTQGNERTGLVTEAEYSDITALGCKAGDREKGILNFFEAVTYRDNPNELPRLVENLNLILPETPLDVTTTTLSSESLRTKIAAARQKFGFTTGDAMRDTHMSRQLKNKIAEEARKLR